MSQIALSTSKKTIRPSARTEFWTGVRDTIPLIIGGIPFGLIFGTLAAPSGLSFMGTLAMSAFVFAGSAQFIALGLLAAGTAWPVIVLTTFVVNVRHALYSATLAPYLKRLPHRWQVPLAFWLTDETFVIAANHFKGPSDATHRHWYYLGSALFMYTDWQLCTFLGLTIGRLLPSAAAWGLDFAMPVTFIGLVIPYLKNKPMVAAVVVAGVVALMAASLPHQAGLMLGALTGIVTGVVVQAWSGQGEES